MDAAVGEIFLLRLPRDILMEIARILDPGDILCLSTTCRQLRFTAQDDIIWRRLLESVYSSTWQSSPSLVGSKVSFRCDLTDWCRRPFSFRETSSAATFSGWAEAQRDGILCQSFLIIANSKSMSN